MELRQSVARRVRPLPFVLAVAALCLLALAFAGWQAQVASGANRGTTSNPSQSTTGFQGPDAQERNAQFRLHETTHGQ
jgi:cytoskeletal protein RodZ